MSRRFRFWSRVFLPGLLIGGVLGLGLLAILLSRYPWTMVTNDYANAKGLRFMAPWPLSPLQEEMHSRKKRRLPKGEMERIFQLDMRRMDYLNVPIFDVAMSRAVRHSGQGGEARDLGFAEYPWPWLETERKLGEGKGPQNISYMLVPQGRGLALAEGMLCVPGDELEFSFPLAKLKRYFRFFILPMNTGTLKINIGPYAWARTFTDADVNQVQFVSVPINDSSIGSLKLLAASSKVFLMGARVTQSEMSGRLPIQVAGGSPFWNLNPAHVMAPVAPTEVAADDSRIDENAAVAEAPKPDEGAASTPAPPEPTETPEPQGSDASKSAELDSLEFAGNQQVATVAGQTVALGYNLVVLHLDAIAPQLLADTALMARLAPRLQGLRQDALEFENSLRLPETDQRAFRQVVAGERLPQFVRDNPRLLSHELARQGGFNLYRHMRNFGYQVLSVAPAPVMGFSPELAWVRDVSALGRRWLDGNDWNHARRRVKIDRDAQPLKGLEAVFAGKEQLVPPPLVTSDYTALGRYFERVAHDNRGFPDWQASEIFLPDERENYGATVMDYLQNWTSQNRQIRFFAHIWASSEQTHDTPMTKDLLAVALARRIPGLSEEMVSGQLGHVARQDRWLGQFLDLLKSRRITHRTVVVAVIPDSFGARRAASVLIKIPGVLPKGHMRTPLGIDDLVTTSLSFVGVPAQTVAEEGAFVLPGRNLEAIALPRPVAAIPTEPQAEREGTPGPDVAPPVPVTPDTRPVSAFFLALRPGERGCDPVVWRASSQVFGLETSHPVVESSKDSRELTLFPCSIPVPLVMVRWFQALSEAPVAEETTEARLRRDAGGSFRLTRDRGAVLPRLFLGGRALRLTHPLLAMLNPTPAEVDSVLVDYEVPEGMSPGVAFEKMRLASLALGNALGEQEKLSSLLLWRTRTSQR